VGGGGCSWKESGQAIQVSGDKYPWMGRGILSSIILQRWQHLARRFCIPGCIYSSKTWRW